MVRRQTWQARRFEIFESARHLLIELNRDIRFEFESNSEDSQVPSNFVHSCVRTCSYDSYQSLRFDNQRQCDTSSSAVAERPRDILRVSLQSASTYLQRSFLLLVTAASDLLVHKINFENIFIRFGTTHERDGRTDGQTPHDDIGRTYASHRAAKTRMVGRYQTVKKL